MKQLNTIEFYQKENEISNIQEEVWQALNGSIENVEDIIFDILKRENFKNSFECLTNIVSVLGNNLQYFLEKLILNEQKFQTIIDFSYYHKNGFDKLVLLNHSHFKLRLHVWKPENISKAHENIHDHRWAFASKILYGGFQNQIFEEIETGDFGRFYYTYFPSETSDKYETQLHGIRNLSPLQSNTFGKDQIYYLYPETLHRILSIADTGAATLMLTGTSFRADCRLYAERLISESEKMNSHFSKSYIIECFDKVTSLIK